MQSRKSWRYETNATDSLYRVFIETRRSVQRRLLFKNICVYKTI